MNKLFEKIPFVDEILKGIGQIMLQENRWTGIFFLLGMAIGNWRYAAAAALATAMGTLTARLLKFDAELIRKGVYGFNPALVGVTLNFLFDSTTLVWILVMSVGGILTVLLHQYFILKKIVAYTVPYILVTWLLFVVLEYIVQLDPSKIIQYTLPINVKYGNYVAVIGGFGEVIFQENLLASFLIFLGVYISRPITALYGIVASLLATLFSEMFEQSPEHIHMGLFGFNAVLTAVAFAGLKRIDGFWVLVGSFLTIFINLLLINLDFFLYVGGFFTLPFVLGAWITLWFKKRINRFRIKFESVD